MIDLTPLTSFLSGLGPYGALAGAVIVLVVNYYRNGTVLPKQPAPTDPQPTAPSAPDPAPVLPVIPNRPLLNAGLALLQLLAQRKAQAAAAPVSPYAAATYDQYAALEDDVLKRVAAEIAAK